MSRQIATSPVQLGLTLLVLATASGCASAAPSDPYAPAPGRSAELVVDNQSMTTVDVHMVLAGAQVHLGRVQGLEQRSFPLRRFIGVTPEDLRVRASASRDAEPWTSDRLQLDGGERVTVVVRRHLPMSTMWIGSGDPAKPF